MVKYNPKVLEKYATRLYRHAEFTIIYYTVSGIFSAFVLSLLIYGNNAFSTDNLSILFLLIGALIGVAIGLSKTLEIRARAQRDLLMIEIEKHLSMMAESEKNAVEKRLDEK